ncbi:MAG: TlpA family protein disulfide reductase, partial [Xanthomonadales bacterium]|nr:TlpA family protein disulfide reductase [Xanthomonadales bacterium]
MRTIGTLLLLLLTGLAQAASLVGSPAPDALGIDKDNQAIHVSDYRGKVVVLTFWASWCGYCLKELPVLENLQRKVGSEQIAVVAINTDRDHDKYR